VVNWQGDEGDSSEDKVAFMSGYSEFSEARWGASFLARLFSKNHFHRLVCWNRARGLGESTTDQATKTIESRSHRKPGIPLPTCAGDDSIQSRRDHARRWLPENVTEDLCGRERAVFVLVVVADKTEEGTRLPARAV